jgi:hypothetical protein
MKDLNTSNEATMQDTPPINALIRTHEEMLKIHPQATKEVIAVVDGNAYTWKEDEQVWRFDLAAQAKLMAEAGPVVLPPGDMDLGEPEDNTIRTLPGMFNTTDEVRKIYVQPRRGDGLFIGKSVAFWDDHWKNWADCGPLPERVTKHIPNQADIDLSQLFELKSGDEIPTYIGPQDGVDLIGSFHTVEALRKAHPVGEEYQGAVVGRGLWIWSVDAKDWEFVSDMSGPGPGTVEQPTQVEWDSTRVSLASLSPHRARLGRMYVLGNYETKAEMESKHPTSKGGECVIVNDVVYLWDFDFDEWVPDGKYGREWHLATPVVAPGMEHAVRNEPVFKHDTIPAPPRPGSDEDLRQRRQADRESRLLANSKEHPSINDAISMLEGEESDAAFKALDALKKVRKDIRHKRIRSFFTWLLFFIAVGCGGYLLYKWLPTQVVTGGYTVPKNCSAPFGKGEVTGTRYYDYRYQSLFGIHFTLESTVTERTVLNVGGQEFTVFGISPKLDVPAVEEEPVADKVLKAADVEVHAAPKPPKGKWWRLNILPGDKGTMNMKPAEMYLFASEKDTAMVSYKTFCSVNKDE